MAQRADSSENACRDASWHSSGRLPAAEPPADGDAGDHAGPGQNGGRLGRGHLIDRAAGRRVRLGIERLRLRILNAYKLLRERLRRDDDDRAAQGAGRQRACARGRIQVLKRQRTGGRAGKPGDRRRGLDDAAAGAAWGRLIPPTCPLVTT